MSTYTIRTISKLNRKTQGGKIDAVSTHIIKKYASSLKQQSEGRHIALPGNTILIPSKPIFALTSYCCMLLSSEPMNINLVVFGLTRPGQEHLIWSLSVYFRQVSGFPRELRLPLEIKLTAIM